MWGSIQTSGRQHIVQRIKSRKINGAEHCKLRHYQTASRVAGEMSGNIVFSQILREVRFLFCQTGAESNNTRATWLKIESFLMINLHVFSSRRSFLARAYPTMKKNNPQIPIMLRGAAGTHPRVYARYDQGLEESVSLAGLSEKEIEIKVAKLTQT
ncbi:NADH-ubiquinone oxidoreductase 10.5 kDa subunit [Erysiphe neolycopersici]|uniref:NADH-ubiquinone oxidoreductase 10.5 kDa subunit n=1 Tax=Erysiphe neolycopersici TaxID=212602 RepID=A0A420HM75_9PEZI|nr:NADH-ubiquinone oxidoreductase 10.5 kDa subunit [Erysiphe neolycopersici]